MTRTSHNQTHPGTSSDYAFWIMAATFTFMFSWYAPVLAQELFALSTDTGLEFYEVQAIQGLDRRIDHPRSALWPERKEAFSRSLSSTPSRFDGSPIIDSGFQTTVNGRILTLAGKIDWSPLVVNTMLTRDFEEHLPNEKNLQVRHMSLKSQFDSSLVPSP